MIVKNWSLLERAILNIIDNPLAHSQGDWVTPCGSAACVFGWTVSLAGLEWHHDGVRYDDNVTMPDGRRERISRAAQDLLFTGDPSEIIALATREGWIEDLDDYNDDDWNPFSDDLSAWDNSVYDILCLVLDWAGRDGYALNPRIARVKEWMDTRHITELKYFDGFKDCYVIEEGIPA